MPSAPDESPPTPAAPAATAIDPILSRPWYGVRATPRGVVFRQPLALGRSVFVAGEFNHWSDNAAPLRPNDAMGLLEAVVPLGAGTSQYRLVVDGQWISDPYNPLIAPNPFGGANSLVIVPEFTGRRSEDAA